MAQRNRKRGRRGEPRSAGGRTGPARPSAPASQPAKRPAAGPVKGPAAGPAAGPVKGPADGPDEAVESPDRSRAGWPVERPMSRSQRRDAEVRAGLTPIEPGERPGAIVLASVVAGLLGLANLIAFAAGVKIGGKHPAAGGIVIFSVLMIVCAVGMWRLWYGAVLGFMALLAIIATIFALLLIEASNVLGLLVALAVIAVAGYLFFKLVRVLSRIQLPRYPGR